MLEENTHWDGEKAEAAKIQLVILDIDGTLTDSDHKVRAGVRDAIQSALNTGLQVTLASGRNTAQITHLATELNIEVPLISLGGACISSSVSAAPIRHLTIPQDLAHTLIDQARKAHLGIMTQTLTENFLEADLEMSAEIRSITTGYVSIVDDITTCLTEIPSKITLLGDPFKIADVQASLDGKPLCASISGQDYLDITPQDADKGAAVQHLLALLGLEPAEVAAVGDGHNDISMFRKVGYPIAMGNAVEEVQQYARLIAPTNDDEGAAWAIHWILQHNKVQ
jgi:Cof subfamily protein (haloacid dehalogenase superfamily)